jgi:lipoprotein-anchoring transpeptidase ErfK/SrfK
MGKPGHETPYGTYVVMSEHAPYTMDSGTYGVPADSPGGYRTTVDIANRLSNSGSSTTRHRGRSATRATAT